MHGGHDVVKDVTAAVDVNSVVGLVVTAVVIGMAVVVICSHGSHSSGVTHPWYC